MGVLNFLKNTAVKYGGKALDAIEASPLGRSAYGQGFGSIFNVARKGKFDASGVKPGFASMLGMAHGSIAGTAYTAGKYGGMGAGWLGQEAWNNKVAIGSIGLLGASYMGYQYNKQMGEPGNPIQAPGLAMEGIGAKLGTNDRGNNPFFLQSQMSAIADQSYYEQSSMAGMGSPMTFSNINYSSATPGMGIFQRSAGYSANALGATGQLGLALHNLRRH